MTGYFDNEFMLLETIKGEEIVCIYWEFGKLKGYRGKLKEIKPYDYINIENIKIDFVGQRTAIQYIMYQDKTIIYSNPGVENYKGSLKDVWQIVQSQKELLGYSKEEEMLHQRKNKSN